MRTNYILIDHENVQPDIVPALKQPGCKVIVFVGANQTKLSFETAAALQHLGEAASYVKITGNGPNALDLHIAFHIGQISQRDPASFFHIISKDKGFDPLVKHLKSRKILAMRSASIAEIPLLQAAASTDKQAIVVARLRSMGASKPTRLKTLTSTVHALFLKQLPEPEVAALVKGLAEGGFIKFNDTQVVYSLPKAAAADA